MKRPWMPLYIADYRADTAHLSAAEHGAYLLLIMHYWSTGSLPSDDAPLARIACMTLPEWRKARPTIAGFFSADWKHKRIDEELAHAEQVSLKRSASAKQRHSNSSANAPPNAEQMDTQSQSQRKKDKTADAAMASEEFAFIGGIVRLNKNHFEKWTQAYPNIDLRAELTARDAWLGSERATDSDRRNWFISTSKYLANRNLEAKSRVAALRPNALPEGAIPGIV